MVTYGFYNSVDHDRTYDATQVSELFDGLIEKGVYEFIGQRFAVNALSSGFQVSVGTGRAWFNHTWTKNDAELVLTLPAPPTLPDRYRCDAVVLDINSDIKVRENKITYVSGEESASENPPHPSLSTGTHYQVPLAWITRVGREEKILQSNINYVVGTSVCPYVVGVLQKVDITAHVAEWQAAWEQWFQGPNGYVQTQKRAFEAEIAEAEEIIENATDDINENVAEFRVWIASQKSQFNGWMDHSKNDFDTWFANLQYILDGDVAGHLQNEIDAITSEIIPIERGGTGNDQGYIQTGFKDKESTLGEFVTSEGMNTVASGKCAHAEGGGNYSYQHQDNHFESENILRYDDPSSNYYIDLNLTDIEGGTTAEVNVSGPRAMLFASTGKTITSFYVGKLLRNKTTGEILKTDIICIGEASRSNRNYTGHIVDPSQNITFNNNTYKDYGFFNPNFMHYSTSYWYTDGLDLINLYEPIDFYVNLPYASSPVTITGTALSDYNIPFTDVRSSMVIDITSNTLKGVSNYNDLYERLDAPSPVPGADFSISAFTINADYSYSITYTNKNVNQHTYRIKFSLKYGYDYIDVRNALPSYNLKLVDRYGTWSYAWIDNDRKQAGVYLGYDYLRSGGFTIGTEYSLEYYYSYTLNDTENDVPLIWIPAGDYIDIEGSGTKALGDFSHAEGYRTIANGDGSHTEGSNTTTNGHASHAEGQSTTAGNDFNHTYGDHAEGFQTIATSKIGSVVGAAGAHAEGHTTQALAGGAHAEGYNTIASGEGSHAGGIGAIAYFTGQFVHGTFGFGGNLEIIENQDKTYDLPNGVKAFSGGLFLMRNNTSLAKTLKIQLTDSINGVLDRSRALWLMIVRDVPDETLPYTSNSYVGMFFIKYNIYATRADNLPTWTAIKEEGTSSAFEFGTPISNEPNYLPLKVKASNGTDYLNFEVQFIRVM